MQPVHFRPIEQVFQMANVTWSCCTIVNSLTCSTTLKLRNQSVWQKWGGGAIWQNSIWTALIVGKGFPYYVMYIGHHLNHHLNYAYHTSIRKTFTSATRGLCFRKTSFPSDVRLAFRVDWEMCVWMSWRARISFLRAHRQLGSWMYIFIRPEPDHWLPLSLTL